MRKIDHENIVEAVLEIHNTQFDCKINSEKAIDTKTFNNHLVILAFFNDDNLREDEPPNRFILSL